jgi:signal transduction histidine kinase
MAVLKRHKAKWAFSWKETSILAKDRRKIPVRFSGAILSEGGEIAGSVCFFHDLTEIKRLEQEIVNAERLAAIGQTVASIAHYIKNILSGLKGGIYVVNTALEGRNTNQFRTGWEMIQRNVGRISDLVMDLLNYSKERELQYQLCSPNDIVHDVCQLMEPKVREHGIEIIKEFDPSISQLYLSPEGIHNVILNLVSNAVDACIFDSNKKKKWWVKVRTFLRGDKIIFEVSDNGCGMGEEVKDKLFTSFFSTKGGKGTGLGLLVTQKIVKEHGGTMAVRSEKGKGSTFIVKVPKKNK